MRRRLSCVCLAILLTMLPMAVAWSAPVSAQVPTYRFDDVYGSNGSGAQWAAITGNGGSVGASTETTMETAANFVNSRDHLYIQRRDLTTAPAIDAILLVIPGTDASMRMALNWLLPVSADEPYTQNILTDFYSYRVVKTPLSAASASRQLWQFDFSKIASPGAYSTARGNAIFQQNPRDIPSQALQIPLIVANVCNDTAEGNPLLFRATMRETYSDSRGGNIVAYDRFQWTVANPLSVGGDASDWVFVPITQFPIDSNVVNYQLNTEITNYSGVRYALQRYDGLGRNPTLLYPAKWAMDLPADVTDVNPNIVLDELSHIPPGLITTYQQNFNVVSGVKSIFDIYPVDPPTGHRLLDLTHPSIFGIELGTSTETDYAVTGFQFLSSSTNFLANVASAMGAKSAEMPRASDNVMNGAVSQAYVAGDAINTLAVAAKLPASLVTSGDTAALLPLHITMNMPRSNRFVAPKWEAFLSEWRKSGNIKNLFSNYFTVYSHDADGNNVDLFKWLKGKNVFEKSVKVFLDEDKDCLTISFIAMLTDGKDRKMALAQDKSVTTDHSYLVISDGNKNDMWDMTFFTAPVGYLPSDEPSGGGGSGGCRTGSGVAPLAALGLGCALLLILTRRGQRGTSGRA